MGQFSQLKEQTGDSLFAYRTHNFQTSIYYGITFIRRKIGDRNCVHEGKAEKEETQRKFVTKRCLKWEGKKGCYYSNVNEFQMP